MSDSQASAREELLYELPMDAAADQSEVKPGYYRARSGQQKLLTVHKRVRRARVFDPNNFAPVGKSSKLIPVGDELIIKCDVFKDEAMCRACAGKGHSDSTCAECGGTAVWWVDANGARDKRSGVDRSGLKEVPCSACLCSTYDSPFPRSTGRVPCAQCKGTGQRVGVAGIALAAQYESVPTTGVILAIGPDVVRWSRGDRCLFDTFTGKEYEYEGRKYRIIKQQYPMCKVVGQDDIRISDAAKSLMP